MEKDKIGTKFNFNKIMVVCCIVLFIFILTIVGVFIFNFYTYSISKSVAEWGQFGDYIGGLLNPLFALINIVLLVYISISINRIEDNRNEFTLQELARPLAEITLGDYENSIEVKLKNCGLGPLKISNISILKDNIIRTATLIEFMPKPPHDIVWTDFLLQNRGVIVAKDSEINLLLLIGKVDNINFENYKSLVRSTLKDLSIMISYQDIYGREMKPITRELRLFGRTL